MKQTSTVGQIFHARCEDLSFEGKGICKNNGEIVFVDGMFPGDEGDIEIAYRRAGQLFGVLHKLTLASPDRMEPRCKVASACGGCQFQAYAYPAQLAFKQKEVKEQFRKIARLEVDPLPTMGMEDPYYYRDKIQVPFGIDGHGHVYSGFYKERTHVIVPINECFIEDKRARPILTAISEAMTDFHIPPYEEEGREGEIRYALIKTSYCEKDIMTVLVTCHDNFSHKSELFARLMAKCPEITTLIQNINDRPTNAILGNREKVIFGPGFIKDRLGGIEFKISARSFYQINPIMTEKLYKTSIDFAKLTSKDVVLDAYSGIGTIGLIAAKKCQKVLAVEIVPEAVKDAAANAKLNGITNFEAHEGDSASYASGMVRRHEKADVVFIDPPRKGCEPRFLAALKRLKPRSIVYVSCNPATLARDVSIMKDAYDIGSIQPVDLFPQTAHVETVVRLTLRTSDKNL